MQSRSRRALLALSLVMLLSRAFVMADAVIRSDFGAQSAQSPLPPPIDASMRLISATFVPEFDFDTAFCRTRLDFALRTAVQATCAASPDNAADPECSNLDGVSFALEKMMLSVVPAPPQHGASDGQLHLSFGEENAIHARIGGSASLIDTGTAHHARVWTLRSFHSHELQWCGNGVMQVTVSAELHSRALNSSGATYNHNHSHVLQTSGSVIVHLPFKVCVDLGEQQCFDKGIDAGCFWCQRARKCIYSNKGADDVSAQCKSLPRSSNHVQLSHFSSIQCTAGLQKWPLAWPLTNRNRICMMRNVCISDGQLTLFVPPNSANGTFSETKSSLFDSRGTVHYDGWSSLKSHSEDVQFPDGDSSGFVPRIVYSRIPADYVVSNDADVHLLQRHSDPNNFGHIFIDDFASAFAAMQLFDRVTYRNRIVLASPCSCCDSRVSHCTRGYSSWILGLSQLPAVAMDDYPDGTCFRTSFIGHSSALSQAYYSPLRGTSISLFRDYFVQNYMHSMWKIPSLQVAEEKEEFHAQCKIHSESTSENVVQPKLVAGRASPHQHIIYLYNKTKDRVAPGFSYVWPDVCSLQHEVSLLVPGSRVECIDFQGMDLGLQIQTASEATVHVTPHGGVAFSLLFSRPGCSALILVDEDKRKAKDIYILPNLPWMFVMYLHRADEDLIHDHIMQAVLQASLRLGLPPPIFDFDAAKPFLQRRLEAHAAAAEKVRQAQLALEQEERLLMASAALQLADDIEQSLGYFVLSGANEERTAHSGIGIQVMAHRDLTCAVLSNTRMYCWGHLLSGGIRFSQPWPALLQTRGAFLGQIRLIHTVLSTVGLPQIGFMCGQHVDYVDATQLNSNMRLRCMSIQLKQQNLAANIAELGCRDAADVQFGMEGLSYQCVIMQHSGEVQCSGINDSGQLGDGTVDFRNWFCSLNDMSACRVPLPLPILALSVGLMHACAVAHMGAIYCWGSNAGVQLGDGSDWKNNNRTMFRSRPVLVSGMQAGAVSVTASHDRTHAIMANGAFYSWGYNVHGCLGDGTSVSRSAPVRIRLPERALSTAATYTTTCTLLVSGQVWCWGLLVQSREPVLIFGSDTFVGQMPRSIVGGSNHFCVVVSAASKDQRTDASDPDDAASEGSTGDQAIHHSSDTVWCWGQNSEGQLGIGPSGVVTFPTPVQFDARSDSEFLSRV